MKNRMKLPAKSKIALGIVASVFVVAAYAFAGGDTGTSKRDPLVEQRLKTFDQLDFDYYSNQKWDHFNESHTDDVVVVWPDGRETKGLKAHIEDLKYQFTFAPDTSIKVHPVKFGSGEWTAVIGEMTGTFSKPMVMPDGKTVQPTGKTFKIPMATIAHWKGDKFDKEYLFWDNQAFMKQIGLAK